jgi:hypothetical protein
MAAVDKDKSKPNSNASPSRPVPQSASATSTSITKMASEAFDVAIVNREEARRHPDWILPVGDPRRRRAQQRFDAACEAARRAGVEIEVETGP